MAIVAVRLGVGKARSSDRGLRYAMWWWFGVGVCSGQCMRWGRSGSGLRVGRLVRGCESGSGSGGRGVEVRA